MNLEWTLQEGKQIDNVVIFTKLKQRRIIVDTCAFSHEKSDFACSTPWTNRILKTVA